MVLYTIVPIEQVLDGGGQGVEKEAYPFRALYMGEEVTLVKSVSGEYAIDRLLSTNPRSFLKTELSPGSPVAKGKVKFL